MLTREFKLDIALQAAEDDGIEKGIEKGIESERKEFLTRMLNRSFSDDDIIALMDISADKLSEYKASLLTV